MMKRTVSYYFTVRVLFLFGEMKRTFSLNLTYSRWHQFSRLPRLAGTVYFRINSGSGALKWFVHMCLLLKSQLSLLCVYRAVSSVYILHGMWFRVE